MDAQGWARTLTAAVGRVIYGKEQVVEKLLVTLLCRGHALLEDVPGVGKTVLARALSTCLGGEFRRIQCTPDLLPADVLGGSVYHARTGRFEFRQGPVMTNILLVDEINRATPRTQSGAAGGDVGAPDQRRGRDHAIAGAVLHACHREPGRVRGHLSRCLRRSATASS